MSSEGSRAVASTSEQGADKGACGPAGAWHSHFGPEGLGHPGILVGQGGAGSPFVPSGAAVPNNQCSSGSPNGQGNNYQGDPGVLGGYGIEGALGSAATYAPGVAWAARASGPGGDAAAGAGSQGNRQVTFTLRQPFESYMEAEMARLAMDRDIQIQWHGVQMQVKVYGNVLFVKWIAEDLDLLKVSLNYFLHRLSLVLRNIQHIRSLFPPSLGH